MENILICAVCGKTDKCVGSLRFPVCKDCYEKEFKGSWTEYLKSLPQYEEVKDGFRGYYRLVW